MRLNAEVEGEKFSIELRREGERVFAEVDGRRYELEARAVGAGEYLIVHEGRVHDCRVDGVGGTRGASEVTVRDRAYKVNLTDPKHLRGAGGLHGSDGGRAQVTAPMPGKVVRVMVEVGQQVEAGEGVVVVEAMKMQNEMKSPKTGTIAELHALTGATVNAGDVLVIIE